MSKNDCRCYNLQDVLTISSPGAIPVPRLCGVNHGYHLYVEMPGELNITIFKGGDNHRFG